MGKLTPSPSLKKLIAGDEDNDLVLIQPIIQLPDAFTLAHGMMPRSMASFIHRFISTFSSSLLNSTEYLLPESH